jgi:diguanylate cyclase (GGDEF)-like protein
MNVTTASARSQMRLKHLPTRIAAVMIGTILVFMATVWASNSWLSQALDDQAQVQSIAQIQSASDNLLTQVRLTALDYAKWEAAVTEVDDNDLQWIKENVGWAAQTGEVVQLVIIWGGRYLTDFGWLDDDVKKERAGLLDPGTIEIAEGRLADIPVGAYDSAEYFSWRDGSLYAISATRFELLDAGAAPLPPDHEIERLIMGRRITEAALSEFAESFVLTGLEVVRQVPSDRPSVPLLGGNGQPVAYFAWDMPRPGTAMLHRMALPLIAIVLATTALAAMGMALVRRNAQHLVLAEQRASMAARTDDMTHLPNRAAFNDVLRTPAQAGERAILFLDVNDFKRINDSIGHEAGDQVIVCVAQRLSCFAGPDCFLARIAGDEFVFVLTGPGAESRVRRLAQDAREGFTEPFVVLGHHMQIRLAMGYAVQASDDMRGDDLVRQADLAMYEAKRHKGQTDPVAYGSVIEQASRDATVIERGLRRALERGGEITIAYQPIVGADKRLARAEALARWTSPELGDVAPDRFIAVAEQAGLIVPLGRRLFQLICDDLVRYPDLSVSINISTLQLMAPDFIPMITGELHGRGIRPSRIEIELTEAVLVDDSRLAAERLDELHAVGFSTALDDFGTGYSSVGYLQKLGFDTLKIDRSFVSGIALCPKRLGLLNAMILMAHNLDLQVVCEGVETGEELGLLQELGCDWVQGYHLDRPLPVDRLVDRWLRQTGRVDAVA